MCVCSVLGGVVIRVGQKKKEKKKEAEQRSRTPRKVDLGLALMPGEVNKWTRKERPLLANYLENCEFSDCFCNTVARVHCCCSSTPGVLSVIVAPTDSVLILFHRLLHVGAY